MDAIATAAAWVRKARCGVSFSGAGLSVASGLPTYRGAGGLWEGADPDLLTERYLQRDPAAFWAFFRQHWLSFPNLAPNPAHHALVALEAQGHLAAHVTQNVDGLLRAAGAARVYELHGNLRGAHCLRCHHPYGSAALRGEDVPRCPCGGVLRPDIVMFEDPLDALVLHRAAELPRSADLLLIVGTALAVEPAASLVAQRLWQTPTVIIDPAPLTVPGGRVLQCRGLAEVVLPAVLPCD